jgi:hypothetical protein
MTHGLKSLAQQLPQYGRYGDDMVAHISSDEARLLKSLGGSGTINPTTGLPEFFGGLGAFNPFNPGSAVSKGINQIPIIGDINKAANDIGTKIFQPVEKAVLQPVGQGLASFDKAVGSTIPGGWGTVASVAGSAMGLPTPMLVGMGALSGSGVMRKGGSFNLQGAMMGGAMAYASAELGNYARGAEGAGAAGSAGGDALASSGGAYTIPGETGDILVNSQGQLLNNSGQVLNPSTSAVSGAINASPTLANSAPYVPPNTLQDQYMAQGLEEQVNALRDSPSMFDKGLSAIKNAPGNAMDYITTGAKSAYDSAGNALDSATKLDTYTGALDRGMTNAGKTASGVGNLLGLGEGTAKEAAAAAAKTGINPMTAAGAGVYAGTGLMALEEQKKHLEDSKKVNAITQAEYDSAMAEVNRSIEDARKAVKDNPFSTNPSRDVSIGETLYGRSGESDTLYDRASADTRLYAEGGQVSLPPDDQTNMASQSPINFLQEYQNTNGFKQLQQQLQQMQPAGLQTMLPLNNTAQTSASQSTGPQSYYGGSAGLGAMSGAGGNNAFPLEGQYGIVKMAAGGMAPRFLSGGGDGMSDSIPANIGGSQEARLADGEFVIPADVVSHLGNGSSKAGAKQLYSMMDKVRTARTGRKSQGKQINPRKYLAA